MLRPPDWYTYADCPTCKQRWGRPCKRIYHGRLGRQELKHPHPDRPRTWDTR